MIEQETIGEKLDRELQCGQRGFLWRNHDLQYCIQDARGVVHAASALSAPCRKRTGPWIVSKGADTFKGSYFARCPNCGATTHVGIEGMLSERGQLDVIRGRAMMETVR